MLPSPPEDRREVDREQSRYERWRLWVLSTIIHPVTEMEAGQVGNCVAVGMWGGIFPIPGATTFAVLVMCWILPVHFSTAMQSVAVAMNVLITPIQWGVFPLFIIYGSYFLQDTVCDPISIISHFTNPKVSFIETMRSSSACIAAGCLVWTALGVPFIIITSTFVAFLVQYMRSRQGAIKYSVVPAANNEIDIEQLNDELPQLGQLGYSVSPSLYVS